MKAAITADDKKRKENDDEPLRRKPDLVPIRQTELPRQFEVTVWAVLHTLARATSLSWRGAGRELAEHRGALKYTQALTGGDSFLGLTDEGRRIADHYKSLQPSELGIGFALTLAEHILATPTFAYPAGASSCTSAYSVASSKGSFSLSSTRTSRAPPSTPTWTTSDGGVPPYRQGAPAHHLRTPSRSPNGPTSAHAADDDEPGGGAPSAA
ncbi:hypothetical protein [Streptomyces sp. NPDC093707]|uniref:hypothetical protein n=1 Tax=Streptomyces sp. NPDC093707 TaxID=3154984 RepID=UPI003450ACFE